MTENETTASTRKVRPSFAAALTLVGLGVGFYYAGQRRTAIALAAASVALGVVLGAGFLVAIATVGLAWAPNEIDPADVTGLAGWAISGLVAIWAWAAAARQQRAPRVGPKRLWGYLAIWLAPLLISVVLAGAVRFFFVQPFRFPSGSMQPTIEAGDYLLVNKRAYGYGRFSFAPLPTEPSGRVMAKMPKRGDIVAFRPDATPDQDFIKRLVGLPGDKVQIVGGHLRINGAFVKREALGAHRISDGGGDVDVTAWRETLPGGAVYTIYDRVASPGDDTQEYVVAAGHFLMLGDDRDNSADSRFEMGGFGTVPFENLVGRVDHIAARRRR